MRFLSWKPSWDQANTLAVLTFTKFAWWPTTCDDGYVYWLCRIVIIKKACFLYSALRESPRWKIQSSLPQHKLPKATIKKEGSQ